MVSLLPTIKREERNEHRNRQPQRSDREDSPPARRVQPFDYISDADAAELARLLGKESIHCQGESIPASHDYYAEYIDRAEGRAPSVYGRPYWD